MLAIDHDTARANVDEQAVPGSLDLQTDRRNQCTKERVVR